MENLYEQTGHGRKLFFSSLSSVDDFPEKFDPLGRYFGLFLALDEVSIPDDVIVRLAGNLLKRGLVYVYCWGPDSERVHDLFDSVVVENNPNETEKNVILTSWLENETLRKALWSFVNVAFPAPDYDFDCQSAIVIVIGNTDWATQVSLILGGAAEQFSLLVANDRLTHCE